MKCLLYCTIALPWLYQGADGKWYVTKSKCAQVGCKPARNGYVSFECDCKEAFYIPCEKCDDGCFRYSFVHTKVKCDEFFRRSHLLPYELDDYSYPKSVYAFHLENVKPIAPFALSQCVLYKDEKCIHPLTKAPQNYCFAYEIMVGNERFDDWRKKVSLEDYWSEAKRLGVHSRKVLVFSVQSPWLCKIANGEKDLEVRKTRIANAGIEYK